MHDVGSFVNSESTIDTVVILWHPAPTSQPRRQAPASRHTSRRVREGALGPPASCRLFPESPARWFFDKRCTTSSNRGGSCTAGAYPVQLGDGLGRPGSSLPTHRAWRHLQTLLRHRFRATCPPRESESPMESAASRLALQLTRPHKPPASTYPTGPVTLTTNPALANLSKIKTPRDLWSSSNLRPGCLDDTSARKMDDA